MSKGNHKEIYFWWLIYNIISWCSDCCGVPRLGLQHQARQEGQEGPRPLWGEGYQNFICLPNLSNFPFQLMIDWNWGYLERCTRQNKNQNDASRQMSISDSHPIQSNPLSMRMPMCSPIIITELDRGSIGSSPKSGIGPPPEMKRKRISKMILHC